ncbi:hypothetical protein, partial [Mycobacteroides abscessus]|uniref:hypothetical protein n=1 Tax=Mycobacteroides abscessus TaxID=36809 RepID=UPI001A970D01
MSLPSDLPAVRAEQRNEHPHQHPDPHEQPPHPHHRHGLLGSFLVPFTVVLFVIERVTGSVSTMQLIVAFFVGGILGVLGASLLEADLRAGAGLYIVVGFVEEFVKGVLL